MPTIFRLDASIRPEGSVTRAVANTLEEHLVDELGDPTIIRRDIGQTPVPATAWADATLSAQLADADRSLAQRDAVALAATLADELVQADAFVFAVPLYNFGVSQHVKTYIDLVMTDPRFGPRSERPVAGRPAYLVLARGGAYGPGTPRDGWDHSTSWLRRILGDVWGLDVRLIEAELTLARTNPAMADLVDLADQNLATAHLTAADHGRALAGELGESEEDAA